MFDVISLCCNTAPLASRSCNHDPYIFAKLSNACVSKIAQHISWKRQYKNSPAIIRPVPKSNIFHSRRSAPVFAYIHLPPRIGFHVGMSYRPPCPGCNCVPINRFVSCSRSKHWMNRALGSNHARSNQELCGSWFYK